MDVRVHARKYLGRYTCMLACMYVMHACVYVMYVCVYSIHGGGGGG